MLILFPFCHTSFSLISAPKIDNLTTDHGNTLVLYGATVIDGTGAKPRPNSVIIIQADKIHSIVEKNQYQFIPNADVELINLTGRYIIPGLFDMHAHVANVRVSSYNQSESIEMLKKLLGWGSYHNKEPRRPHRGGRHAEEHGKFRTINRASNFYCW